MTAQYQGVWSLQSAAQLQSTQRWVTDPLFENTTLLLQADDAANGAQNNTFLDSSSNAFAITRNGGNPGMTQGSFTPFSLQPGAWGNYFASGAVLNLNGGTPLTFGTGDFTIEFWVYYNGGLTADVALYDSRDNVSGNGVYPLLYSNPTGKMVYYVSSAARITSTTSLVVGTWYHVALARSGTSTKLFINGIQEGSTYSDSNNYLLGTNRPTIGAAGISLGADPLNGYMSNVRVVKGRAVYTSAFTPPTEPLGATSGGQNPPTGTQTSLLTCQSNRFVDNGGLVTPNTISVAGGSPSVQPFSPFAPQYQWTPSVIGGSGYFDGTGDYLSVADNIALNIGTSDFQISFWVYPTAFAGSPNANTILFKGSNNIVVDFNNSGTISVAQYGVAVRVSSSTNITLNQWAYIVVSRVSNTTKIFLNGSEVGSASDTSNYTSTTALSIGLDTSSTNQRLTGYLTNFRMVKGSGVTSVTVPTAPQTAITNTSLLLNFTNAGIYDGTMKNNLETVGNAQISTAVVKYGSGSMYFDGTGDGLTMPSGPNFAYGTGDFTIEFWAYFDVIDNNDTIYIHGATANTIQLFFVSGKLRYNNNTVAAILDTSTTIPTKQWLHLVICRSNSTARWFINGILDASTTDTTNWAVTTTALTLGRDPINGRDMNGYLDDFRITKGIARYTQNFIPPSVALPRQ